MPYHPSSSFTQYISNEDAAAVFDALIKKEGGSFFDGVLPFHNRALCILLDRETDTLYRHIQYLELPSKFTEAECSLFQKKKVILNDRETVIFVHESGRESGLFEEKISRMQGYIETTRKKMAAEQNMTPPTSVPTVPIFLDLERCSEMIFSVKKVLFYAGAGISAHHIPTNQALYRKFGYTPHAKYDPFISILLNDPERIKREFLINLTKMLKENPLPTAAHHAIAKLAPLLNAKLVTTNFDPYFELANIKPYDLWAEEELQWSPEVLRQISIILVIGCGEDSLNFIKKYKQHNPAGVIIAFNLDNHLDYLSNTDFLLQGDVQLTITELHKLIVKKIERKTYVPTLLKCDEDGLYPVTITRYGILPYYKDHQGRMLWGCVQSNRVGPITFSAPAGTQDIIINDATHEYTLEVGKPLPDLNLVYLQSYVGQYFRDDVYQTVLRLLEKHHFKILLENPFITALHETKEEHGLDIGPGGQNEYLIASSMAELPFQPPLKDLGSSGLQLWLVQLKSLQGVETQFTQKTEQKIRRNAGRKFYEKGCWNTLAELEATWYRENKYLRTNPPEEEKQKLVYAALGAYQEVLKLLQKLQSPNTEVQFERPLLAYSFFKWKNLVSSKADMLSPSLE